MELGRASTFDVISTLPRVVIDAILVRLPFKDAVRTSILSSNWRYKWVTIPHIIFDWQCDPTGIPSSNETLKKCVNIVYQVLLRHRGSIHKFKCVNYLPSCSDFDQWILFLSGHGIKELILEFSCGDIYKLPSYFFSCQELYNLRLQHCIFKIPQAFEGFSRLKSLYLCDVVISSDELQCLISKSPLLESLTYLDYGYEHTCPKINIPDLRYLYLGGSFEVICIENTPVEELGMHKVLCCLRNVEVLRMHNQFLKFLAVGDVPEMVPNTFGHLKNLSLDVDFENGKEILAILCLFRSSRRLEELEIRACFTDSVDSDSVDSDSVVPWEAQEQRVCMLKHLRTVTMDHVTGNNSEIEFIRLLLANSPVLKTLTIDTEIYDFVSEVMFLRKLIRFRRASTQAEILFND
ncbi:F-box/FBD/LRR-repeat protein At1g13570-like [Tasmannia lanceolata]|uniref:F-box/FBD/LRR-repeat protein At1g13570-like n=1 Tax=Tasmannia lanceolata TaxID=3420 RepID=UPI004062E555